MSKLIICLLLLFNIYICKETKDARVFTKKDAENEISVKFVKNLSLNLKIIKVLDIHGNVNKEETKESLQLLRIKKVNPYKGTVPIFGLPMNVFYYFKAVKETNETVSLKFSYGRHNSKTNILPNTIFKINVN